MHNSQSTSRRFLLANISFALAIAISSPSFAGLLTQAEVRIRTKLEGAIGTGDPSTIVQATTPLGFATSPTAVSLLPGNNFVSPTPLLVAEGHAPGQFSGNPLAGAAQMSFHVCVPFPGTPVVCSFTAPFFVGGATGTFMREGFSATGGLPVHVSGTQEPFRDGTVYFGPGTFTAPLVGVGTNQLTPGGNGQVTLVAPIRMRVNGLGGTDTVGVAELELHFAPEPATAILLGSGALFAAWIGLRRRDT